jgi:hypothetical protein
MEIWYDEAGSSTRRDEIMAKILIKIPEPKEEYDFSNQKQISRALSGIVEQLNSTFLQQQKEDQERFTWYLS